MRVHIKKVPARKVSRRGGFELKLAFYKTNRERDFVKRLLADARMSPVQLFVFARKCLYSSVYFGSNMGR